MFEESQRFGERSITSRIGSRIGFGGRPAANAELIVENLHYNVTEKDLQVWVLVYVPLCMSTYG